MPDTAAAINRAVEATVIAVQERERKTQQGLRRVVYALATVIVVMAVALAVFIYWAVDNVAAQSDKAQVAFNCGLVAQNKVMQESLNRFAKRFGAAEAPPVPGLPHECGGSDPVFVGTSGNDVINGTTDPDWMNGEEGNDSIFARGGGDTVIGYKGIDILYGGPGTDYLYGGDGPDELRAGGDERVDHLDGGAGTDTCYVRSNDVYTGCERIVRVP